MTLPAVAGLAAALALVLALLVLLAWGLGRLRGGARGTGPGRIVVAQSAGLAPRQGVAVVEIDGRRLLLGYGDGGVRLLTELDGPVSDTDCPEDAGDALRPGRSSFEHRIGPARPAVPPSFARGPFRVLRGRVASSGVGTAWRRARAVLGHGTLALVAASVLAGPVHAATQAPRGGGDPVERSAPVDVERLQQLQQRVGDGSTSRGSGSAGLLDARIPDLSLQVGSGDGEGLELSGPVGVVVFMGFLTLLPTLLLLMTSFTRILVILHLLKQAIGTQTAPPAHLLAALALLLTGFVMAPTLSEANRVAVDPWVRGEIDEVEMISTASVPFRTFMLQNTRSEDLATFVRLSRTEAPATVDDVPMVVLTSAFVTSELRAAFQMGFALFLPFVVIDLVVASVLMSMGMFMLPPVMVSLPFKLLLFVLVDGWSLVVESIVRSFP